MSTHNATPFGHLLRYWRDARRMSQLDVALAAQVSARHISYVETGRAQPSRDMVLLLVDVLDVPLRERNTLLQAAGYAPRFRESPLDAPALESVRKSIDFMLEHHKPYPAVLVDRHWNLLSQNRASAVLMTRFIADRAVLRRPFNVMRTLFEPGGLRPFVVNWEELAAAMIQRLHREAALSGPDDGAASLVDELLAIDGVPADWRKPDYAREHPVIIAMHLKREDLELKLFSAITTLGTPLDVTLQELRIETFFPADPETDQVIRRLVPAASS